MHTHNHTQNFAGLKRLLGFDPTPESHRTQKPKKRVGRESKLALHAKTIIELKDGEKKTFREIRHYLIEIGIKASISTIHAFYHQCKGTPR